MASWFRLVAKIHVYRLIWVGISAVVYAHTQVTDPQALCVLPDDAQGARLAVEHLVQSGRRHFAHITGPSYFEAVRLREGAMRQVLAEHAMPFSEQRVLSGPWQESWGYTAAQYLIKQDPTIDALFCGSDQLARGAVEALHELVCAFPMMWRSSGLITGSRSPVPHVPH